MTFLFIFLTFFWGVGSLFLVAVKTNSVKTVFLKTPSILIGDFFILPAIAGIIGNSAENLDNIFTSISTLLILLISFCLTIISTLRNRLIHTSWIPHLMFYWFMTFIILLFLSKFALNLSWWLVLIGAIVHQSLGILFHKKFPHIKDKNRHSGTNEVSDRIWNEILSSR